MKTLVNLTYFYNEILRKRIANIILSSQAAVTLSMSHCLRLRLINMINKHQGMTTHKGLNIRDVFTNKNTEVFYSYI